MCTQVEKELSILRELHHPHLVSFMFIADQGSRISIVMDWAGENLREHRTVTQSQQYTEDVARYMMYQLTSALVYMHSKVGCCGRAAGAVHPPVGGSCNLNHALVRQQGQEK